MCTVHTDPKSTFLWIYSGNFQCHLHSDPGNRSGFGLEQSILGNYLPKKSKKFHFWQNLKINFETSPGVSKNKIWNIFCNLTLKKSFIKEVHFRFWGILDHCELVSKCISLFWLGSPSVPLEFPKLANAQPSNFGPLRIFCGYILEIFSGLKMYEKSLRRKWIDWPQSFTFRPLSCFLSRIRMRMFFTTTLSVYCCPCHLNSKGVCPILINTWFGDRSSQDSAFQP